MLQSVFSKAFQDASLQRSSDWMQFACQSSLGSELCWANASEIEITQLEGRYPNYIISKDFGYAKIGIELSLPNVNSVSLLNPKIAGMNITQANTHKAKTIGNSKQGFCFRINSKADNLVIQAGTKKKCLSFQLL